MIKQGNLIFVKEAQNGTAPGWQGVKFRGFGYGFLLGTMSPTQAEPPDIVISIQLGQIGLIRLDDVKEFLGDELLAECIMKWQAKYNPVTAPPNGADPDRPAFPGPPPLKLETPLERKNSHGPD